MNEQDWTKALRKHFATLVLWFFFSLGIAVTPILADGIIAGHIPSPDLTATAENQNAADLEEAVNNTAVQEKTSLDTQPDAAVDQNTPTAAASKAADPTLSADNNLATDSESGHSNQKRSWLNIVYSQVFNSNGILLVAVALLGANLGDLLSNLFQYGESTPPEKSMPRIRYSLLFGIGVLIALLATQVYGGSAEAAGNWPFLLFTASFVHSICIKLLPDAPPPAKIHNLPDEEEPDEEEPDEEE